MKRTALKLADITALDNLALATWKAARGKRCRPDVQAFVSQLDDNLAALAARIHSGAAPAGRYRAFYINDPKRRLIHAACFADRVLHHALMNIAEPGFESALVPSSYACRPGYGVHRAVEQVQRNLQRFPWFAQVDIDGYFPAVDHARLKNLLAQRFKGREALALFDRIIDSHEASPGCGLPIGSLTSQHCANLYLSGADRFLLNHRRVQAHVRYMDDMLWWCATKDDVGQVLAQLRDYLLRERGLQIKANAQINRSAQGVSYCGYRITRGTVRLSARKQRRYRQLRQRLEQDWQCGAIDGLALQRGYDAVHAITLHADSRRWRQQQLVRRPPPPSLD